MRYDMLKTQLALDYDAFSISRVPAPRETDAVSFACINQVFPHVQAHGALVLTE